MKPKRTAPSINKRKSKTIPQHSYVYMNARREWNERYGSVIKDAHNWRLMAFIVGACLITSIGGNVLQAYKEKIAVYYVTSDSEGRTTTIWRADQAVPGPKSEQVRAALQDWLLGARTVYMDSQATRRVIDKTYAMTLPDSSAYQALASYHKENNPYRRAQNETVEIQMQTPTQLSKDTWIVEWNEVVKNSKSGKLIRNDNYQLTANIMIAAPKTESELMKNPVGLFVRQYSWHVRN